jgi:hypothetical protein
MRVEISVMASQADSMHGSVKLTLIYITYYHRDKHSSDHNLS